MSLPDITDIEVSLLLEGIFRRYQYDFRGYAAGSTRRRIHAALLALRCDTVSALQGRVLREPAAFAMLLQFLTVQVSDLFRDPLYFRALRERIAPILATYPSLRIWVAGCSTGEEAYSVAIVLREMGLLARTLIYATDINPDGLRRAAEGVFPVGRLPVFAENHRASGADRPLAEHYAQSGDVILFDPDIKRRIVFSEHSLASDNVFAEVQLISCRNVLIYFDPALQDRAVRLFRDALCRRGFLGLGASESLRLNPHRGAFGEFVREVRWYQRAV